AAHNPYTPQQNGVAERKNRTIVEMAKCLMLEKKIPFDFWAEAVNTSVYILNRCPTKALSKRTPFEAYGGRKPGIKHLKVFGSLCYAHVPKQQRQKLDLASKRCIFLGYGSCEKGYRLYNIETEKVIISRDVIFSENECWDWNTKKETSVNIQLTEIREEEQGAEGSSYEFEEQLEVNEMPTLNTEISDQEREAGSQNVDHTPLKYKSIAEIYEKCNMCIIEPESFEEAAKDDSWKKAMEAEITMIEKNNTWELVNRPFDKPIIGVKWIYKTKLNLDGSVQKNKARLVAKGYSQKPGIDFNETFAPVARLDTVRTLKKYAKTLLDKFGLKDCKSVATPLAVNEKLSKVDGSELADETLYRQMVGSLLYLTATRPDIMFAASLLARFMHNPTKKHMGTAKRVLRYVQGTINYGIAYDKGKGAVLIGYCDSDWSGSEDDMRSTSGYAFNLGSGAFSWASIKQSSVALSTAEAEYMSAAEATAQAINMESIHVPTRVEEALKDPKWAKAMDEEMLALQKNTTWEVMKLPIGKKTVGCRWVFTVKYKVDGTVDRYKARLVAKGYTQTYGVDYQETFSPVAKMNTVRVLISLAANMDWPLKQFDVKNAFLHGNLEEEVYMDFPPGYSNGGNTGVCRLRKSLYGLKQSPRAWFGRFTQVMRKNGYCQSHSDHTLFVKHRQNKVTALIIYVDDMIITGNDVDEMSKLQGNLAVEFEMKDLGDLKYFLGVEVARSSKGIFLSQRKYVLDLLKETGMLGCKPVETPIVEKHHLCLDPEQKLVDKGRYQRLVGRLIYLAHTRPDIAYAVSVVSQFMHSPSVDHMAAVLRILAYLKSAPGKGVLYRKNGHLRIEGFTDADWAGDVTDRRSTSGYFTFVGGNLVTWRSKKQKVVSRSSAEAEYRGMAQGICEILWLRKLLWGLGFKPKDTMQLFCDNKSARDIADNPVQHDRTKHVEVDRHFIKEKLEKKIVSIPFQEHLDKIAMLVDDKELELRELQGSPNALGFAGQVSSKFCEDEAAILYVTLDSSPEIVKKLFKFVPSITDICSSFNL
ncbi:HXXXD-type acyl-transferase family protein, partial [Prunus dulcis]